MSEILHAQRVAAETWFRRRGLPLVVRQRVRAVALLPRATPAIVFFLLIEPLVQALAYVVEQVSRFWPDEGAASTWFVLVVLGLTLAAVVIPILGGWLVAKLMRRFGARGRMVTGLLVLALAVVLLVVEQATGLHEQPFWVSAVITAGGVLGMLLLTYFGAGSILAWAARVAVRQLGAVGTLASKALPLLMIVILLSFFTTEVWQLVAPEYMSRARLWGVVAFLAVLGVLFLRAVVSDEMRELQGQTHGVDGLRKHLADTPFASLVADDHQEGRHPLSAGERFNVVLVFFFAQAVQIMFFALMVFGFFLLLGTIAVTDGLLEAWLGDAWLARQAEPGTLFGVELPVSNELIHVSIFLAAFSGLYFAGAAATDPLYRDKFFDPLVADVRVSLAAREAYLARWGPSDASSDVG